MSKRILTGLVISACMALNACMTAIPVVREADMVLSGAIGSHLYPPQHFNTKSEWIRDDVVVKHVPGHQVGSTCALYGNVFDMFLPPTVSSVSLKNASKRLRTDQFWSFFQHAPIFRLYIAISLNSMLGDMFIKRKQDKT